jgi:hypothetical protein
MPMWEVGRLLCIYKHLTGAQNLRCTSFEEKSIDKRG